MTTQCNTSNRDDNEISALRDIGLQKCNSCDHLHHTLLLAANNNNNQCNEQQSVICNKNSITDNHRITYEYVKKVFDIFLQHNQKFKIFCSCYNINELRWRRLFLIHGFGEELKKHKKEVINRRRILSKYEKNVKIREKIEKDIKVLMDKINKNLSTDNCEQDKISNDIKLCRDINERLTIDKGLKKDNIEKIYKVFMTYTPYFNLKQFCSVFNVHYNRLRKILWLNNFYIKIKTVQQSETSNNNNDNNECEVDENFEPSKGRFFITEKGKRRRITPKQEALLIISMNKKK